MRRPERKKEDADPPANQSELMSVTQRFVAVHTIPDEG